LNRRPVSAYTGSMSALSSPDTTTANTGYCGILLAAGTGSRFDPAGVDNKLLAIPADLQQAIVLTAAANLLQTVPVLAVCRTPLLVPGLTAAGCSALICTEAGLGMSASLKYGLQHAAQAQGWIIALGDMPYVKPSTYAGLLAALKDGVDIAVPVYQGQRGNPVAFSRHHLSRLLAIEGDRGARQLLKEFSVQEIPVNDPGIHRDIDTRDDLHCR